MAKKEQIKYNILNCVPYQVCPICKGEGFTTKYMVGSITNLSQCMCSVCQGRKIIPMCIVNNEIKNYPYKPNDVYINDGKGGFIPAL